MKFPTQPRLFLAATAVVALLGGCASSPPHGPRAGMGAQMQSMDMQAMCERHKQMMAGKSPQEQQAMMQEQMKAMSPDMRQRTETMMQQCR